MVGLCCCLLPGASHVLVYSEGVRGGAALLAWSRFGVVVVSKKLSYHLLPISLSAQVLGWNGMWPGSRVTSVVSGGDGVSCVPMVVLSVVAAILGAVTIVAGIRIRNWALCATVDAILAVNGGLLYWGFKKWGRVSVFCGLFG